MAWDLTKEGLDYTPQQAISIEALLTGQSPRTNQKFFKKKGEAMAEANRDLRNVPPSSFSVSPSTVDSVTPGTPAIAAPQPGAAGPTGFEPAEETPPNVNISGGDPTLEASGAVAGLPRFLKPTAAEVQNDPINSPRTTKLGTFLNLLKTAASGAMAGEASNTPTPHGVYGNAGAGFEAAQAFPITMASRQAEIERQNVQNQEGRAHIAMLPWEIAKQRAQVKEALAHADYLEKHGDYLDQTVDARSQQTVPQQYAAAVERAINRGVDPNEDPEVQRLADAVTSTQRTAAPKSPTELQTYLAQNPGKTVQNFWDDKAKSRAKGTRDGKQTEMQTWLAQNPGKRVEDFWSAKFGANSARQIQNAVVRRSHGMNALSKFQYDSATSTYTNMVTGETLSQGEYSDAAGRLENQFDQELNALGQDPNAVRSHVDQSALPAQRSAQIPANPWRKK